MPQVRKASCGSSLIYLPAVRGREVSLGVSGKHKSGGKEYKKLWSGSQENNKWKQGKLYPAKLELFLSYPKESYKDSPSQQPHEHFPRVLSSLELWCLRNGLKKKKNLE